MYKLFNRDARGFTLIELLVVIAIIGILSSIVLASLNSARSKSRDARREADLKQLQNAEELYANAQTNGGYPSALSSLAGTYIPSVPNDPQGDPYGYAVKTVSSVNTNYCIGAYIENTPIPASACPTGVTAPTNCGTSKTCNYWVGE
jgi:prepilin-type N-terminal cleavage/methylation domain-containing protein